MPKATRKKTISSSWPPIIIQQIILDFMFKQVRKELRGNSHEALFSGLLSLLGINMCHEYINRCRQ